MFAFFLFIGWQMITIAHMLFSVPHIVYALSHHIFFMGLALLLFRAAPERKILAVSMLMTATTLVGNFCASFLCCVALALLHTVKNIPEPFLNEWQGCLITGVSFIIEILVICRMAEHPVFVFYGGTKKWHIVLAVPLLAITAVVDVASWGASNGVMVRSGGNMGLYYDQLFSHAEFCVLTGLSMFAAGFYVFGMNRIYLEQRKSSQYHAQIAAYKMLEEQHSRSERLRHDMKNHITALLGLFEGREWEKLGNYLKNMEDSSCLGACRDITGNKAVDALLYQKRELAEGKHIVWECDAQIPKACCINEFDLCVLFGNILDNAIEACERLQCEESHCGGRLGCFINIQARSVKKCFLLEVKNSTDLTKKYRVGFTDKANPQEHGIGLLNVRDVVRRYNGVMNIEAENGRFVISILVPLADTAWDGKQTVVK